MTAPKTQRQNAPQSALRAAPVACFCGSVSYQNVLTGHYDRIGLSDYPFSVVECAACGLARTLPVPDAEQYERGYPQTTENGRFLHRPDSWSARIAEYVGSRANGGRLLDVGCNVGNLVAAAAARGFAAEGTDIDPLATAEARRLGRPVATSPVDDVQGEYDVLVLNHVLEHIVDLRNFLSNIGRLVAPGGRAFIFVPHYRGLLPRLMKENWMGWVPRERVWHFTPASLRGVFEDTTSLRLLRSTTNGVIEPPSAGPKGAVKACVSAFSRVAGWGDQIEAIFEKPRGDADGS